MIKGYGIVCTILSCIFFAILNIILKSLALNMSHETVIGYRAIFMLLIVMPMLIGKHSLQRNKIHYVNIIKGVGSLITMPLWVISMQHMPMSEILSLSYMTPIFALIFTMIFLKESIQLHSLIAVIIGCIGACTVLKPNFQSINIYIIYPIIIAMIWGAMSVTTKYLAHKQSPLCIIFYTNVIIACFFVPKMEWLPLSIYQILGLLSISIASLLAQFFMTIAYRSEKLSVLLPYDYFRLVFGSILAFIFFDEVISVNTIVGSLIILVATIYHTNIDENYKISNKRPLIN